MPGEGGSGTLRAATLGLAGLLLVASAGAQDLFLTGGHLVDPRTEQVTAENLLILDGVIAGRPASPPPGFAGLVLDVTGKWVIPGLHDLHVHSSSARGPEGNERMGPQLSARRQLYAGVTGYLDLLGVEPMILLLRDRQRAREEPDGADIFAAGPAFGGPSFLHRFFGIPCRVIESPEEARKELRELAPKRPDVIKLLYGHATEGSSRPAKPTFDRETLEAAVGEAAELGIPTVVHVRIWPDVRAAARAGATAITHLPSESTVPPDVVEALLASETVLIPTLAIADPLLWNEPNTLDRPLFAAVTHQEQLGAYRRWLRTEEPRWVPALNRVLPVRFESIGTLAEAGVPILSGSDCGNSRVVCGFALHHELDLLVQAGLSPWQALAASTHLPGELLGRSYGLAAGDEGSVVMLDASPIEEIRNTEAIAAVVHHGVVVDREALAESMFGSRWTSDFVASLAVSSAFVVGNLPWMVQVGVLLVTVVAVWPLVRRLWGRLQVGASA